MKPVWTMRAALAAAALATLGMAACDGPGVVSPRGSGVVRAGTTGTSLSVVGTWRRTVYFFDAFGAAHASETSWQFNADGAVARVQVSRNLTFGIADVLVSAGRYRLEGTRVLVDLVTPEPVQLAFEVRRSGNQLELAGETYFLVGG